MPYPLLPSPYSIVLNGSFENSVPQAAPSSYATFSPGSNTIFAWTVTQGNVELIEDGFWAAGDGAQSLDLSGTTAGTVEQTLTTIPGENYELSYLYSGNPNGDPIKEMDVTITSGAGGALWASREVVDTAALVAPPTEALDYRVRTMFFTANHTQTTLEFASADPGFAGMILDDVRAIAVPEPSTPASLLAGLGALLAMARVRSR